MNHRESINHCVTDNALWLFQIVLRVSNLLSVVFNKSCFNIFKTVSGMKYWFWHESYLPFHVSPATSLFKICKLRMRHFSPNMIWSEFPFQYQRNLTFFVTWFGIKSCYGLYLLLRGLSFKGKLKIFNL